MKNIKLIAALCAITFPLLGADTPQTAPPAAPPNNGRKVEKPINFVPFKADPLRGDWQGDGGVVAQVFTTAGGKYQANLLSAFDTESNVVAVLQGTSSGDGLEFSGDGWTGAIKNSHFTGSNGDKKFDLQHIIRHS